MDTETIIKSVSIPLATIAFILIARVVHLKPELITSIINQAGSANALSLKDRAIACDPSISRTLPTMSQKDLNNFVFDCEKTKK